MIFLFGNSVFYWFIFFLSSSLTGPFDNYTLWKHISHQQHKLDVKISKKIRDVRGKHYACLHSQNVCKPSFCFILAKRIISSWWVLTSWFHLTIKCRLQGSTSLVCVWKLSNVTREEKKNNRKKDIDKKQLKLNKPQGLRHARAHLDCFTEEETLM